MPDQFLSESDLERLLVDADSPRKFFPAKFDIRAEYKKAQSLAQEVTRVTQLQTTTEDPSGFQDGSLFTRIILRGTSSEPVGQILLSSFGRLATMGGVRDAVAKKMINLLRENEYMYVPIEQLEAEYNGRFDVFKGTSWLNRYFSSFYVIDNS